jgi:hypothetical protein
MRAAGEIAPRCEQALAEERAARRALRECEEKAHDVTFQMEQLRTNSALVGKRLADDLERIRQRTATQATRRGELYRKLISASAALPV